MKKKILVVRVRKMTNRKGVDLNMLGVEENRYWWLWGPFWNSESPTGTEKVGYGTNLGPFGFSGVKDGKIRRGGEDSE